MNTMHSSPRISWCARMAATVCLLSLPGLVITGCGEEYKTAPGEADNVVDQEAVATPKDLTAVQAVRARLEKDAPVRVRWALDMGDNTIKRIWLPPENIDIEYMLVLTENNDMIAVRRSNGIALWSTKLVHEPTGDPCFTKFGVYFVVQSYLVALERYSGEVIWRVEVPFPPASGPVVQEQNEKLPVTFIAGLDRRIYAVEVQKVVWPPKTGVAGITRDQFMYEKPVVRILWRYPMHGGDAGNLTLNDRKLFAADTMNRVYAINTAILEAGKPKEVQQFRAQGPMESGPVSVGPYVLVASRDHNLYCLNRRDLREVWSYPSGHILIDAPYAIVDPYTNRTVVIQKAGENGPLVGLNDTDGTKPLWELNGALGVIGRFHEPENELEKRCIMVVANDDNTISGHYCLSGEEIWRTSARAFNLYPKNTMDELVYSTTKGNKIIFAIQKR